MGGGGRGLPWGSEIDTECERLSDTLEVEWAQMEETGL